MDKYWTKELKKKVLVANSFEELAEIAKIILKEMSKEGKPIVEICGPISTGGLGSIEKNLEKFSRAISIAYDNGLLVFNIAPFEEAIKRLKDKYPKTDGYCLPILDIFYLSVFKSGYISEGLFLPDWQSSKGARWEKETLEKLGIPTRDYPASWLN